EKLNVYSIYDIIYYISAIVPTEVDHDCAICMDRSRDCVLRPCNHMVTCNQCAKMLFNRRDGCPICRKDISDTIVVYHS
ncbi:hypothetical protein LOTGIDRAFT_123750, partial [Lottia gigantea]